MKPAKIGIVGHKTTIAKAFVALRPTLDFVIGRTDGIALDLDAYLICCGFLAGKSLSEISGEEVDRTMHANFVDPAQLCDRILEANNHARICVIGSESGISGSYDAAYAGAKAAMHLYIETKQLRTPAQQLFGIAPHIMADSGMTRRRADQDRVKAAAARHRAARHISAMEVAQVAADGLFGRTRFLSNTIIQLRGDKR
jgi:NAD(P)-dependent dehydrogenase (short-subunit alcohol dehydrogenase family)